MNTSEAASSIRPEAYQSRIVDAQIAKYLTLFGAVEVSGTKWCGKTWSSLAQANSVTYVDRGANLQIVEADPSYALVGDRPHVIDEWQRVPAVWDTVRHAVDGLSAERGAWILTGSSTPHKDEVAHSGAGRIGRVRMHPMTLAETGESTAKVSLAGLFDGEFTPSQCPNGIGNIVTFAARGGWPQERLQAAEDAQIVVRDYLEAIFTQSVTQMGGDESVARRLAVSLARNLGQATKADTVACDVYAHDGAATDAERKSIAAHLDILKRMYLIDEVPGWVPASRSPKRMRIKPKRYFADPSLPVALLGLSLMLCCRIGRRSASSSRTSLCATSTFTHVRLTSRPRIPCATTATTQALRPTQSSSAPTEGGPRSRSRSASIRSTRRRATS